MACCLPETQTPASADFYDDLENVVKCWGRLYPTHRLMKNGLRSNGIDLYDFVTTIGRADSCDIVLTSKDLSPNQLTVISKVHFSITKEVGKPAYILDKSKNGTYVNKRLIGKDKQMMLANDDEIALGQYSFTLFIYKTLESSIDVAIEVSSKYVISKLLGNGACGEVRLVFSKFTCKQYAMKKVTKGKTINGKTEPLANNVKISNEIKILKKLSHPGIVKLIDVIDTDRYMYIVMEYMEGGELFDRIMSYNKMTEDTVKLIFYQIVLAVDYLHRQGVTHRDLKPENILLQTPTIESVIKVADFGLSKIIDEEEFMKTLCGTPSYVAPEILEAGIKRSYTSKVDVWSLGVILFFCLSQKLPFMAPNRQTLCEHIIRGDCNLDIAELDDISPNAKDLIKQILVVDPMKRATTAEILAHPWIDEDMFMISKVASLTGMSFDSEKLTDMENNDILNMPPKRQKLDYSTIEMSNNSHFEPSKLT